MEQPSQDNNKEEPQDEKINNQPENQKNIKSSQKSFSVGFGIGIIFFCIFPIFVFNSLTSAAGYANTELMVAVIIYIITPIIFWKFWGYRFWMFMLGELSLILFLLLAFGGCFLMFLPR